METQTTYDKKLKLIAEKARQDRKYRFPQLLEVISTESLKHAHKSLNSDSACGIDGVTVKEYGENLGSKIENLYSRIKTMQYWPKAVKRVYIPKSGKKTLRPLGLPSIEDKLVQMNLKEILGAIYEQDFLECSHGFRPGKSCHTTIKELNNVVMQKPINYVVEVDIKGFFDSVDHKWLFEMLGDRISDPRLCGLVWRMLKAGVVENNSVKLSEEGTPQGGIVSPILANIYLHYVLDLWFEYVFKRQVYGYVQLIRYCDDFVVACESEKDARMFLMQLKERLAKFKLEISQEKTRIVKFGTNVWKQQMKTGEKPETFEFLGFTHYCKRTRNGSLVMGHKTAKQRLASKLKDANEWLRKIRSMYSIEEWWKVVKAKLIGHYNYFGINGNFRSLRQFYNKVVWLCFKWLNRRSQKRSMNYERYLKHLQWNPLPEPRIYHRILY